MTKRDLIIFFSLAFVWAMSFIFYRVGVPEFGSLAFSSLRVVFAGLTMLVFVLLNADNRRGIREHLPLLALVGMFSAAIPFTVFAFSAQSVNAGVMSVLNASVPMMSSFIASMFFGDRLSRKQILGLIIGILGVMLLMSEHLLAEGQHTEILPMSYALFACIGYAIGANVTRNYLQNISPIAITAGSLLTANVVMVPLALYSFPYERTISAKAWLSVMGIGIISTALALIFMNQLIKRIGPTRATSITLVIPIFAILLGYVLLDESLDVMAIVGSAVILFGTYLSLNLSLASFKRRNHANSD